MKKDFLIYQNIWNTSRDWFGVRLWWNWSHYIFGVWIESNKRWFDITIYILFFEFNFDYHKNSHNYVKWKHGKWIEQKDKKC